MRHPKAVGDQTTLAAMLALQDVGFIVSVPFGENARYDLVIDDEARLGRVQCKTGRLRDGAVQFKVCSSYAHHANPASAARDYLGQIEYFAVYCPDTSGVYVVPIDDVPLRWEARLRVAASRNGQERRVRHAADYEIGRVVIPRAEPGATSGA
jgi:hypothetical protein